MKRLTKPNTCTCSLLTDSIVVNCLVGTEIVDGAEEDLEQILLKESWHLGAEVEKSEEAVR